jgi:YesN/AraC family two-component response regulator
MEFNIEVLTIDNYLDTAQSYADLIETHCHLKSVAMSDIDLAIKCISENPIKVVVLDQRMPTLGTDVFVKLKKVNPFLKIIMVSGEASFEEADRAKKLGFSDFLHKKNIAELPNIIYRLRSEYEKDILHTIKESNPFHKEWRFNFFHIGCIRYYLLDYKIINENFEKITEWKTLERINEGEKQNKEVTIDLKVTDKISIQEESKVQLKNAVSINHKSFLSKLDIELDNSILLSKEMENTKTETSKKTSELSLREDEIIDGKKVVSKIYETNQVYSQILLHIKKACGFCKEHTVFPLMIYKPINKKVFRQISYTEDNKDHIVNTGHFTW